MLAGAAAPLFSAVFTVEDFQRNLEFISLSAWIFSGALTALAWAGLTGMWLGFFVGLADALWKGTSNKRWRLLFGALGGFLHSAFLMSFSLMGLLEPVNVPRVYVPLQILYGAVRGMTLTLVIPRVGTTLPISLQVRRALLASGLSALLLVMYAYPTYLDNTPAYLLRWLPTEILAILGLSLGFSSARPLKERGAKSVAL
jgi:hypothetical protein